MLLCGPFKWVKKSTDNVTRENESIYSRRIPYSLMNMQYENSSKLRSLKLNRRNSAVLAVMLFALAAVALPAAAETTNPATACIEDAAGVITNLDECWLNDGSNDGLQPVSYTHLTLPTIITV